MKKFTILLLACFLAGGCVQVSLFPLYTDEDLVFDSSIIGEWVEKDSGETWNFTGGEAKEYNLLFVDDEDKIGEFVAHLVNIQGRLFLDIFPKETDLIESDTYQWHLLSVHSFLKVKQIQPTLQLSPLSPDWVEEFLEEHPEEIRHEIVDGRVVLTAKPKELQGFLIKHENTEGAFEEPNDLIRKEEDLVE